MTNIAPDVCLIGMPVARLDASRPGVHCWARSLASFHRSACVRGLSGSPPAYSGPAENGARWQGAVAQTAHGRHASSKPPEEDEPRLAIDVGGRPSMYSQAQDSAEVKGPTLHTDPFELRRELQRSLEAMDARGKQLQARNRQATPRARSRCGGPLAGGADGAAHAAVSPGREVRVARCCPCARL
jgi:hypothetical protein